MRLARVWTGALLATVVVAPSAAQRRPEIGFDAWASVTPTWDRNQIPPIINRASGLALGVEGGGSWRRLAGRFGFERGSLKPDGISIDRDRIEGFALIGGSPIPELSFFVGPHARALVVNQVTERWLWWEVRGRAVVPIVERRLDAYADAWSALAGSVSQGQRFGSARGGAIGVALRFARSPFALRLGYGIDQMSGGTIGRRETVEGVKIAFGPLSRD